MVTEFFLSECAHYIMTVDMFPVFFAAHFTLAALIVRDDSKDLGAGVFRQSHPFAMWCCTVLAGLSGVFVANFLFANPLVDILKEHKLIMFITLIWYLVNYCPYDIVYRACASKPIKILASVLQEFLRVRFIYLGLEQASKIYPGAYIIMVIGGAIKGNGYGFLRIVERLIRGKWTPEANEILNMTYFAKSAVYASIIFLLHHIDIIAFPIQYLYCAIVAIFVVFRLTIIFGEVSDPLSSIEKPICSILFRCYTKSQDIKVKTN
ncbi:trimeric intracellular cation channel type A [Biomphalaria pfeifferi]|uniref:Trimeric intracellular cation channel type A n=1 Tax=Biomphalaria pfeifferi TaxID=112525 RepID=A0AAD8BR83_BIOPF|nr:trimeric intracellular cation channel type A [Biomphalaria pfeifferi]